RGLEIIDRLQVVGVAIVVGVLDLIDGGAGAVTLYLRAKLAFDIGAYLIGGDAGVDALAKRGCTPTPQGADGQSVVGQRDGRVRAATIDPEPAGIAKRWND